MRKVIILGRGSTFMITAIGNNLSDAGYRCIKLDAYIEDIRKRENEADIVVIYLSQDLLDDMKVLIYIKDLCLANGKFLYLIGDEVELREARRIFPERGVTRCFEKPLDIKNFISTVDALSSDPNTLKRLILFVDDDSDYLEMAGGWLEESYRVVRVNSGMQAIKFLANNKPDLILLDYAMPVTTGPQVLEMIKSEPGADDVPVVFLTGRGDKESVMKVVELKPDGYLLKTIGKNELLKKVEEFVSLSVARGV
ncbi:MAG: response regulator [Lachnospiraceae bacterium]|nr:response regulator [Lachnospiraceae bacterium]